MEKKEYAVPDIRPAGFIMEILDSEQKPVAGVKFNITVDDGDTEVEETDKEGVLKISRPKSKVDLSLAGEKELESTEEESPEESRDRSREPSGEDDVLTPTELA